MLTKETPGWQVGWVLCLVLALVGLALYLRPDDETVGFSEPAPEPTPDAEFHSTPPRNPFAGSPADEFASGAAGIVLPRAKAVPGFTASQVAAALGTTRKLLAAGAIDPAAVGGGRPENYLRLLYPEQRAQIEQVLAKPTKKNDATAWFVRFDPREAALVGSTVKVRGTVTYRTVGGGDILRVHTDHLFVYAVRSVRAQTNASRQWTRVVAHRIMDLEFRRAPTGKALDPVLIHSTDGHLAGARCGFHDGWVHPSFDVDADRPPNATRPPVDPYQPPKALPEAGCGAVTRI